MFVNYMNKATTVAAKKSMKVCKKIRRFDLYSLNCITSNLQNTYLHTYITELLNKHISAGRELSSYGMTY